MTAPGGMRPTAAPRREDGGRDPAAVIAVLGLLLFSLLAPLAIALSPREGQTQFAIIAAPWRDAGAMVELVAHADGAIVAAGGLPNVIFASSADSGFAAAAYRAGAWLVLDPVLLRGCLGAGGSKV